jgi:hypothetical protein
MARSLRNNERWPVGAGWHAETCCCAQSRVRQRYSMRLLQVRSLDDVGVLIAVLSLAEGGRGLESRGRPSALSPAGLTMG